VTERIALVRRPSSRMGDGIVTHLDRTDVDPALASAST
jgi:dimethylargininase